MRPIVFWNERTTLFGLNATDKGSEVKCLRHPFQWKKPAGWPTFQNRRSDSIDFAVIGQGCRSLKVDMVWPSLSSSLFSFFTQLLLSLFMWTTECNTMNAFEERLFENGHCYTHLYDSVHLALPFESQLFAPSSTVAIWKSFKHFCLQMS